MANDDAAAREASPVGVLTVSIRYAGPERGDRGDAELNPIPAIGQLLVGLSELERQLRRSRADGAPDAGFSLTPTVLTAGDPGHPDAPPPRATVLLLIEPQPSVPVPALLQVLTALAQQIAGEAGLACSVDVIESGSDGRQP